MLAEGTYTVELVSLEARERVGFLCPCPSVIGSRGGGGKGVSLGKNSSHLAVDKSLGK